ncbi:hypothetical protein F4818DRAFT_435445 [Hypoxylon cercidicola]|nr:hypothetical protein F4818DRAFT_435445 [Hypoxylon cercidicola]
MYLKGRPVLHTIDKATTFQAASFLPDITTKKTWETLRRIWIDTYLKPPNNLVYNANKNFIATKFTDNTKALSIEIKEIPVEAHNSIGSVKRYHSPLRRAFKVIDGDLRGTGTDQQSILQMAVKAVNDTAGPDGLVPTLLVFGAYLRLAESSPPAASLQVRAAAIKKAMEEVRRIKMERDVSDALAIKKGPNTLNTLNLPIPSEVKIYKENKG